MTYTNEINLAREAIIMGESSRALALLLEFLQETDSEDSKGFYNELCVFSNAFQGLQKDKRLGAISNEVFTEERNKINSGILESISKIEELMGAKVQQRKIDPSYSFAFPRKGISDKLYNSFLIAGFGAGAFASIAFYVLLYAFVTGTVYSISHLMYIGSIGVFASMFFWGAFDGLNRSKTQLVDIRIVLPHMIIAILLILGSALLRLME
ncbi:MAG: hypothetical protein AAF694_02855 [Bacteroidota bacterium]